MSEYSDGYKARKLVQEVNNYSRADLVEIIKMFAEACSDRASDPEWAASLGDRYDPIFQDPWLQ
jgi:hypothetical protein